MAIEQVGTIKIERGQPSWTRFDEAYCPRWDWESCAVIFLAQLGS